MEHNILLAPVLFMGFQELLEISIYLLKVDVQMLPIFWKANALTLPDYQTLLLNSITIDLGLQHQWAQWPYGQMMEQDGYNYGRLPV